ncbi:unnamed protein product [Chilo suppressalis]|uniref:Ku domain-containing protein n=1 Tax=Chilo suppressalis TaxID=168631 RepID=A0ABN8B0Y6_CHISP|nr:unnamed protein product [Chilo suppressalis]
MDSDEEKEDFHAWRGVPGTIILINVFNSMQNESATRSHVATCRLIRHHLRQANTHYVGVCLYGTSDSDSSNFGSQNVFEVFPLSLPNLDDFKKLQNINITSYSQNKTLIMSDALWHCSKMFANCKKQLVTRTVLLLTTLDVPPIQTDRDPTYSRVKEMVKSDIEIKIINVASNDNTPHEFYKEFLIDVSGNHDVKLPRPVWDHQEIENLMYKQSHRNLAIAQLMFEIGEGLEIGIGVYSLLKSNSKPKKDDLDRDTNALVTTVTKTQKVSIECKSSDNSMDVDEDESENKKLPLLKSELIHYQTYGKEKIEFTDKEKNMISNPFGPPMMKLLGFKPASMMRKEKWYYKSSYFLFPNENTVEGSTKAFKGLHKACIDTSVVAICVLCTRVNSRPNIVALSPCSHPLGLDIEIGFDIIRIPFMEQVRQLSIEESEENMDIPQAHKAIMSDVINKLRFDYKPDTFENPVYQSQFRAIEAIALGDEEMEPYIDTTKTDPDKFNDIKGDLFQDIFGPFGATATKRTTTTKESGTTSKKGKTVKDIEVGVLQDRLKNKQIDGYNITQLKQILSSKDIPNLKSIGKLKKNELVELVYEHFG